MILNWLITMHTHILKGLLQYKKQKAPKIKQQMTNKYQYFKTQIFRKEGSFFYIEN